MWLWVSVIVYVRVWSRCAVSVWMVVFVHRMASFKHHITDSSECLLTKVSFFRPLSLSEWIYCVRKLNRESEIETERCECWTNALSVLFRSLHTASLCAGELNCGQAKAFPLRKTWKSLLLLSKHNFDRLRWWGRQLGVCYWVCCSSEVVCKGLALCWVMNSFLTAQASGKYLSADGNVQTLHLW